MGNQVTYSGDLSFDMTTPPTPFQQPTPNGLQYGKVVFVEGESKIGPTGQADRFSVNFHTSNGGILLHYDVRFWRDNTAIVINSRQGEWQKEERLPNTVPKNRLFRIEVQITPNGFIIKQDNMPPYTFHYRNGHTPDKISKIIIEGNIQIKRVFYGYPDQAHRQSQHQQPPAAAASYPLPHNYPAPVYQPPSYQMPSYGNPTPPMPGYGNFSAPPSAPAYTQPNTAANQPKWIQGGMSNGRQILIQGTPHPNADCFTVDLNGPTGNTALHISARFSEQALVRNSLRAGNWENEERQTASGFPFMRNQPFELQILSDYNGYKIAVNGRHIADFRHRQDASMVQSVSVAGDVSLIDVRVY